MIALMRCGSFVAAEAAAAAVTTARTTSSLAACLGPELEAIRASGTWKSERVIASAQGTAIALADGRRVLNFCANNYLGLSADATVIEAAKRALDERGAGLSSVRFICGTQDLHLELERRLAVYHGRDDVILYASCFDANAGLFEALLGPEDAVISDELNHASIIDGIRLCRARKLRYKHRDMADLEARLLECGDARRRLIATDGVFSMDGSLAPLVEILDLAERYGALTFVDDCHATGLLGPTGRGTEEHYGLSGRVDILNSTLGKALGGAAGGYTACARPLAELLRQRSRPYLFSNSLPPPVVAAATRVLDLVANDARPLERLRRNTRQFRRRMTDAGFTIAGDEHPISPVMLGEARLAAEFAERMLERGVYVIGFSYPVVPRNKARVRVQISAAHTLEEVDRAVDAFVEVGKELAVVS